MSVDVLHRVHIRRSPAEVFAYIAEFENNPAWQSGMVSCRWTSEARGVVGATYVQEARFMGRRIDTHFEVVVVEAGRSISIESTVSTFPIQVTRSVEPEGEGCVVSAHVRGQPTGVLKLFSGMVGRRVARDYANLKLVLEREGPTAGPATRRRSASG